MLGDRQECLRLVHYLVPVHVEGGRDLFINVSRSVPLKRRAAWFPFDVQSTFERGQQIVCRKLGLRDRLGDLHPVHHSGESFVYMASVASNMRAQSPDTMAGHLQKYEASSTNPAQSWCTQFANMP